jgi:hypothetical protein
MTSCDLVETALREKGLLLLQDQQVESIVHLFTNERPKSSWWSHPQAHAIFACLERLEAGGDVLVTRLIGGKATYVHRRLWPAFLTVATAGEAWQTRSLSAAARQLLEAVRRDPVQGAKGTPARDLQQRLLVAADEVHTDTGRHELVLQSWPMWSELHGVSERVDPAAAREQLEEAAATIGAGAAALPWNRLGRRK